VREADLIEEVSDEAKGLGSFFAEQIAILLLRDNGEGGMAWVLKEKV